MKYRSQIFLFIFLLLFSLTFISPVYSLLAGFLLATQEIGLKKDLLRTASKLLMAVAIILYGLNLNIYSVVEITGQYLYVTITGIFLVLLISFYAGPRLSLGLKLAVLIGSGTAICGASAIAAVGSGIKAKSEELSMALAVILIFNALALLLFPVIGQYLELKSDTFAAWAGLAIHDTSSVVGAAIVYDQQSATLATTVKLARAIWIAPLVIVFCSIFKTEDNKSNNIFRNVPWFIWGYLIAACFATFILIDPDMLDFFKLSARKAFSLSIFLVCCSVDVKKIKDLSASSFMLGFLLWIVSAIWSLFLII